MVLRALSMVVTPLVDISLVGGGYCLGSHAAVSCLSVLCVSSAKLEYLLVGMSIYGAVGPSGCPKNNILGNNGRRPGRP
ncbi:hypothetical protein BGW80DRAFT_1293595 [Lactifluus volemus]|nr:hypothetical protein BGW80DRAFT_1293595 [Lactifluus volemus]